MSWLDAVFAPFREQPVSSVPRQPTFIEPPWADFDGGLDRIPVGRAELVATYGDVEATTGRDGKLRVSRAWERESMMLARRLPGYGRPLYVHRTMEPYLREGLRRALLAEPSWRPKAIGCFNPRRMRHDGTMPLSLHSWGVAIDIDAADNGGEYVRDRVEPWSPAWMKIWPSGLPRTVVEAFESCGWEWGGRWRTYLDPMHLQLAWTRGLARPAP
jgi:hypothetical protein